MCSPGSPHGSWGALPLQDGLIRDFHLWGVAVPCWDGAGRGSLSPEGAHPKGCPSLRTRGSQARKELGSCRDVDGNTGNKTRKGSGRMGSRKTSRLPWGCQALCARGALSLLCPHSWSPSQGAPIPTPRQPLLPGLLLTRDIQETHGTCDHRAGDRNKHWEKTPESTQEGREGGKLPARVVGPLCQAHPGPSPGAAGTPGCAQAAGRGHWGGRKPERGGRGMQGPRGRCRGKISCPEKGRGGPCHSPKCLWGGGRTPGKGYPDGAGGSKPQILTGPQIQPGQSSKGSD